jgi:hypothetical protein
MAFIIERITDEDKKKIDLTDVTSDKWAIDKKLNAFFVPKGGMGYGDTGPTLYFFELNINGDVIKIETHEKDIKSLNKDKKGKYDVTFDIQKIIAVPNYFNDKLEEIKNIITEAFKIRGVSFSLDLTNSVTVNFPDDTKIFFKTKDNQNK